IRGATTSRAHPSPPNAAASRAGPRVLCDCRAGNCNVTRNEQGPRNPASAGEAAAEEVARGQVVPRALDAHLDDVPAELDAGVHELAHPVVGIDHPARQVLELVAEDVADLSQRRARADRARALQRSADVAGGPHE